MIDFIIKKLGIPSTEVSTTQIVRIRRTVPARNSIIKFEVLVTFNDKRTRDKIISNGKNLKDFVEDQQWGCKSSSRSIWRRISGHLSGLERS